MRVHLRSVLDGPPEKVWAEVLKSGTLTEIIRPLVRIEPVDPAGFPERWAEGETVRCRSYLFGMVPLGTRSIRIERIYPTRREIQSRESDPLIRRWDHLIRVERADDGKAVYSDEIEIQAGILTVPVWLFAGWFYRHRQRRWRGVVARLTAN